MSVSPYERRDLGNYKTGGLGLGIQILETKTQSKFVDPCCHAHKPKKLPRPHF